MALDLDESFRMLVDLFISGIHSLYTNCSSGPE
jgi:hypothetical protein